MLLILGNAVYSFLMGEPTPFLFTKTSVLALNCTFEDLLEPEPRQVTLEQFSHMNYTNLFFSPLIAASYYCSEILSTICISQGLEIALNIYISMLDKKIYSSLSNKLQEIKKQLNKGRYKHA